MSGKPKTNRALKKRPKVTPSRIHANISTKSVIRDHRVLDNDLLHIAETEELTLADLPDGNISVPLNLWLDHKDELLKRDGILAVQIAADEEPIDLADDLNDIQVIVLPIVAYVDGRSYSHAYKLRKQFNYQGEIRATGSVHFDQLDFLKRAGCDAFELPDSDDSEAALKALTEFTEVYQPSADEGRLIFARRRAIH